jgi:hypothetical protein
VVVASGAGSAAAGSALCANANDGATSADVKSNRLIAPNGFNIFIPFFLCKKWGGVLG